MMLMDWRAMKYYQPRGFLLPIFSLFVGFFSSSLLVMPTCVLLFLFFSLNPFAMEEKGELNNLYLTLPVNRNDIVLGRFMLISVMGILGVIMSIPITIIVNKFSLSQYYLPISWYVSILAVSYLLFSILTLTTYPILFKLGYNKGKFWGLILPSVFMGILYGAFISHMAGNERLLFNTLEYAYNNMFLVSGGISLFATILMIISIMLSKRIYSKREF